MRCSHCDFANPEEMKFCGACGAALAQRCPRCGFESPAQFKFCGACGAPLSEAKPALARPEAEPAQGQQSGNGLRAGLRSAVRDQVEGERRQLTVMFCDLVNSTALSQRLDPEEYREVIAAFQHAAAEVISRFGGHVHSYLGDGILIYFGYPQAHEDDPQRAVRAAIEITKAVPPLSARLQPSFKVLHDVPLQVRVGIHTGLVVVGEMGGGADRSPTAVGETPNIAARLQAVATPNTLVISSATYKLVGGYFVCQSLGPQTLKGISAPVEAYRVMQESGARSRFEVVSTAGLIPLVGRTEEVALLRRSWALAKEGHGQVVLISGEPGIGKSRLAAELKQHVTAEGHPVAEFRCSPYYQNSPYHPIIDRLQRLMDLRMSDAPGENLAKLEQSLQSYSLPPQEAFPLFAALLSLPQPSAYPALDLTPQRQRERTKELLVGLLLEEAQKRAALAVWEDLHWSDPSTLELYNLLVRQASTARIFLLATARPEFVPQWGSQSYCAQLTLDRLRRHQAELMATEVVRGKRLPAEVMRQIVNKTDGVPLFVEELAKMLVESGMLREQNGHYELTGPLPQLAIPSTLHDSLMARLDRLSSVKEIVQLGAVLGRDFSYDLIRQVWSADPYALDRGLSELVDAEILYQGGLAPSARYSFKHALIQDAAYESLLKSKRQQLHLRVAQVIEQHFPEMTQTQPELLAHHLTSGGLTARAITYWQNAGQAAMQRSAYAEAISHLTRGLELVATLPESIERSRQELALNIALGTPLMATKGYGMPEVLRVFERARDLCRQVGETPQLFTALSGLRTFYQLRGETRTAHQLGEQILRLAETAKDPEWLLEANHAMGSALFFLGELAASRDRFEQMLAVYDSQQHTSPAYIYGVDLGVVGYCYSAWVLLLMGYPEQGLRRLQKGLEWARNLNRPLSLAFAFSYASSFYYYSGDPVRTQEWADADIKLANEHGFPFWLALGTLQRGWGMALQGRSQEGIALLQRGLDAWRASGTELGRGIYLGMLAEAYGKVGRPQDGLATLTEAIGLAKKNDDLIYEAPEVYRLKGDLLLAREARDQQGAVQHEAEENFRHAIALARRQKARLYELRAAASLAWLWLQQGNKAEARQMLADIYGWFTEGFDIPYLKAARKLLEELSG